MQRSPVLDSLSSCGAASLPTGCSVGLWRSPSPARPTAWSCAIAACAAIPISGCCRSTAAAACSWRSCTTAWLRGTCRGGRARSLTRSESYCAEFGSAALLDHAIGDVPWRYV